MLLTVNRLDVPLGQLGWQEAVSGKLGHDWSLTSQDDVKAGFLKAWTWARLATKAAETRALTLEEGSAGWLEAQRLAKRHNGVWRGANKMHRKGPTGRMQRTVVAVRADAGDSSCPSWLEREAYNRVKKFTPIAHAVASSGLTLAKAAVGPIGRHAAKSLIDELSTYRTTFNAKGLDIHVVPAITSTPGMVNVYVIAAFEGAAPTLQMPYTNHIIQFSECLLTWESVFNELPAASHAFGPEAWINMHIDNAFSGLRLRQRITCGIFYGKSAEHLITQAAEKDKAQLLELQAEEVKQVEQNIQAALKIAADAASAGDAVAAASAAQYAKCYAEDMGAKLADSFPVLKLALELSARFDLSGLSSMPCLDYVHQMLMTAIDALPLPLPRTTPEGWQCVEHVAVHSPADIARLVAWMKEPAE